MSGQFWLLLVLYFVKWASCTIADDDTTIPIFKSSFFVNAASVNVTGLQPECQKAYRIFLEGIEAGEEHALKMFDATAKLPAGILSGNVNQYGDFDECMSLPKVQYCLTEIDLELNWQKPFEQYKKLVHSYYPFKEKFNDPPHRVPGLALIKWGFCIPQECSSQDLVTALKENFGIASHVRPGMCQSTSRTKVPTIGDTVTKSLLAFLLVAVAFATAIDFFTSTGTDTGSARQVLIGFSLKKNFANLVEVKENNDREIAGLHAVRSLAAFALLMSHKSMCLFFNPYINRTDMVKTLGQPWSIIAKNAIIYTDCFMLLSGLLNANALIMDLYKENTIKFKDKLVTRLFRILPNLVVLILFCTYILPDLGSGPLWPIVVEQHSELCKKYMWRNFLFVHNYFGFENMCLTHTHQLGIDMQLYLFTALLVVVIWKFKRNGMWILFSIAIASTLLRFWISYYNELSSVVYFGISISKMFQTADLFYILPTHRATIYLIGVYTAYLLKFTKTSPKPFTLKGGNRSLLLRAIILLAGTETFIPAATVALWLFFLVLFLSAWFGPYPMARRDYVYEKFVSSLVAAMTPVFWGTSVAFGIYVTNKKVAGLLGDFLCWKYWQVGTKIAYSLYLVQFPIYFYNVGRTRHVDEYRPKLLLEPLETAVIVGVSIILTLVVEMPFQNIGKMLTTSKNIRKEEIPVISKNTVAIKRKTKSG